MRHGDLAGGATQFLPIADGAHEDGHRLLLGELQGATGLVVADGNGAAHGWDLQHTAAHLGLVAGGDGVIGSRKTHGFIQESLAASTGTGALVVHLGATGFGQLGEPTAVNVFRERCTGAVQALTG